MRSRTPNGVPDRRLSTENEQGTGPAPSASPASAAINEDDSHWNIVPERVEPDDGTAALEIENEFRRRLSGIRQLPKRQKAVAYRAAMEWVRLARAALREKRLVETHAAALVRLNRLRSRNWSGYRLL